MGEMTQGQKREQEYFRCTGRLRAFMVRQAADSLTRHMRSAMVTGNHYGTRVIGKTVTRSALRNRGLIDDANMWTALGWAVVLLFVSEEPGWNADYFRTVDDVHAEALDEDRERFPISGNDSDLTAAEHEQFLTELREDVRKNGPTPRWEDGVPGPRKTPEQIAREMTANMVESLLSADAHGAPVSVGGPRTRDALLRRKLVDRDLRWTSLGWAVARILEPLVVSPDDLRSNAVFEDHLRQRRQDRARTAAPKPRAMAAPGQPELGPGWTPERSAQVASEIRSAVLKASAMAIPGQLEQAAELIGRMVKRAQYDALRAVLAQLDGTTSDPYAEFAASDVRTMLNDAARELGCRPPVTGRDQ